jgi:FkbM family methyltransferase
VIEEAATEAAPAGDREERLAYFDRADRYTPYLGTTAGGAIFLVKTEDRHIGRSLFAKRGRGELSVLRRSVAAVEGLLGPEAVAHRTLVDVGANIGTTTIPAVLSQGFGSALAIEPEPENVRILRVNILLNDLEDRVKVLPVAVSDRVGRSDLVVDHRQGGMHWIATDRGKLEHQTLAPEAAVLTVDTVTLDHLVENEVVDPKGTGLLWMDAEAHEGQILVGASSLATRGIPLVLEWNPALLDRVGDRGMLERAIEESYTHFVDMHRSSNEEASFPLQTVDRLPAHADRFLDPADPAIKTDILVVRLGRRQAAAIRSLDSILEHGSVAEAQRGRAPGPR